MFPAILKISCRRGNTFGFAFSMPSFSKIMTWFRHYTIINRLFSGTPKMFPVQLLRLQGVFLPKPPAWSTLKVVGTN